ncbi:MAG: phosphoribosylanthranilate isomerase [Oscillochloris sp.]|nr:phosphoribosylanthranilate isomerase [Oscillochloris sp.]
MLVKICGIQTISHALAATTAGADLIGLVFAPSRRRVTIDIAAAISVAVRSQPGPIPQIVGLFVNEAAPAINAVVDAVGLDVIQLSGDEPAALAQDLARPVIAALRMDGSPREAGWLTYAATQLSTFPRLLVDAHVDGAYGGTGTLADWKRAAVLAAQTPLLLAGGLNPANVATAIAAVRPAGVDVSSGVETNGRKDETKIEAFIAAARMA